MAVVVSSTAVVLPFPLPGHAKPPTDNSLRVPFASIFRITYRSDIIFSLQYGEEKRQNAPSVKKCATTLAILALLSVALALAEDFKTIGGKVYKDATITRVERDGIVLKTKTGISKIYFVELPDDVRQRFQPAPAKTAVPRSTPAAIKSEAHTGVGGVIAAMKDLTIFTKLLVFGIIVIIGVAIAFIRSR
jgi:hypothetical protein